MTLLDSFTDTPATPRVSQLAVSISRALGAVGDGWVEGEVQRHRTVNGHTYFTLADEDACIDCVVWRSRAERIERWPDAGQLVQVHYERVGFYPRRGATSLHVDAIRLTGEGELLARKQATLEKLIADGLVARARRPRPVYPRRVGVVAARDSDAKTDVITALRERWPAVHIVFRPALTEGLRAVDSVIAALAHLQDIDALDVIVLARGGVRDLVAFDHERLCRAVFACDVPVVTSIGHTAQRPNCDQVAAACADVPARAAELVVPSAAELHAELDRRRERLETVPERLTDRTDALGELWQRTRPRGALRRRTGELAMLDSRLREAATRFYAAREKALDDARHHLAEARAKVPPPSLLDLPAQRLRTAAQAFFDDRRDELDHAGRSLSHARGRLPEPGDIQALADRLGPAATRARRRASDNERALDRLRAQVDKSFLPRLDAHDARIAALAGDLTTAAGRRLADQHAHLGHIDFAGALRDLRRRLTDEDADVAALTRAMAVTARRTHADADQALTHIGELIAARDFAVSAGCSPATPPAAPSARSALTPGAELTLSFHDGRAGAAVTTSHPNPEGAITHG